MGGSPDLKRRLRKRSVKTQMGAGLGEAKYASPSTDKLHSPEVIFSRAYDIYNPS